MAVAAVVALAACPASRVCLNEPVSDGVTRSTKAAAPEGLAAVLDLGHIMHFLAGVRLAASLRDALMDVFIYIRANRRAPPNAAFGITMRRLDETCCWCWLPQVSQE